MHTYPYIAIHVLPYHIFPLVISVYIVYKLRIYYLRWFKILSDRVAHASCRAALRLSDQQSILRHYFGGCNTLKNSYTYYLNNPILGSLALLYQVIWKEVTRTLGLKTLVFIILMGNQKNTQNVDKVPQISMEM